MIEPGRADCDLVDLDLGEQRRQGQSAVHDRLNLLSFDGVVQRYPCRDKRRFAFADMRLGHKHE